jgi:GTPase SAR1 family protein
MSNAVSARLLLGRRSECAALDELLASPRNGASRALVLRGEAGVGKSALLEYLVAQRQQRRSVQRRRLRRVVRSDTVGPASLHARLVAKQVFDSGQDHGW